jgi:hypothetical protein
VTGCSRDDMLWTTYRHAQRGDTLISTVIAPCTPRVNTCTTSLSDTLA